MHLGQQKSPSDREMEEDPEEVTKAVRCLENVTS